MYNRDMPRMAAHGLADADGLADVFNFVLGTIQQPLQTLGRQMHDFRVNGENSTYLFAAKRKGFKYVQTHKLMLLRALRLAKKQDDVERALLILINVPSLGIVKAGFVAQCLGFEVACIDSHNLDRLGLPRTALRLPKSASKKLKRKRVKDYIKLCFTTGGAEYWWNSWCEYVADKGTNRKLETANDVSAYHYFALVG